jgi:hypothetical protein
MRQYIKMLFIFLGVCTVNTQVLAGPWFTGPLLAPAGHTVPRGHTNFEIYGIRALNDGHYDDDGNLFHSPMYRSFITNPILTHGFTDWLDVQVAVPYAFNSTQGQHHNRLTDVSAALGIQLLEQKGSPKRIDFRILLQEVFPTGRFDHLNPVLLGTDSTGLGSYQTQVGLNFQYLVEVFKTHYLRTRLILSRNFASSVFVNGLSSYGGSVDTHGFVKPGDENNADLAFEFTLTQNWVAVLEGYVASGQASRFNGILTVGNIGSPTVTIGSKKFEQRGLAPALEYNFNENVGLIGGVWFPVSGRNTSHFTTYMLALNAFW